MNTRITTLGLLTFALSGGALSAQNPFAARRPLTTTAGASVSRTGTPRAVTFTKDVAPILQQKCQSCHQPGSIAPMSLLTYADAKKYSRRIRDKVSAGSKNRILGLLKEISDLPLSTLNPSPHFPP